MKDKVLLLPCPFCGGEAKIEQTRGSWGGYGLKTVYCQSCTGRAPKVDDWNRREYTDPYDFTDRRNLVDGCQAMPNGSCKCGGDASCLRINRIRNAHAVSP